MKSVLDTNIFNKLVDGAIKIEELPPSDGFIATHIQIDELNNTANKERRAHLLLQFATMTPTVVPTDSSVWDVSRFDHSRWSNGDLVNRLKTDLDAVNGGKANNWNDVLIAEISIVNGYVLVTCDFDLANVARKHGANVTYYAT